LDNRQCVLVLLIDSLFYPTAVKFIKSQRIGLKFSTVPKIDRETNILLNQLMKKTANNLA